MHSSALTESPLPFSEPWLAILKRRIRVGVTAGLVVLFGLMIPFPVDGRLWAEIFNLAHAPAFFCLILTIAGLADPAAVGLPQRSLTLVRMTFLRTTALALFLAVAGTGAEYMQRYFGRHASWGDVAANSSGLLAAWIWVVGRRTPGPGVVVMSVTSICILVAACINPALEVADSLRQIREFPRLASFERTRELGSWAPSNAELSRSSEWSSEGTHSLKVLLKAPDFTGAAMAWLNPDWTQFRSLLLDVRNGGPTMLSLIVKIQDREHAAGGHDPVDRFERRFELPAGETQSIRILLSDVSLAPAGRQMNMNHISRIEFFCMDLESNSVLYLDNIRLETSVIRNASSSDESTADNARAN